MRNKRSSRSLIVFQTTLRRLLQFVHMYIASVIKYMRSDVYLHQIVFDTFVVILS